MLRQHRRALFRFPPVTLARRSLIKVPGYQFLWPQMKTDKGLPLATGNAIVYWIACFLFCCNYVRTRLDDSFNSPPIGVGYYASKDRADFEAKRPHEMEVEETSDDYAKWR